MSFKNILVLSVLVFLSTYYAIEGEIIRGEDIPKLNVSEVCLGINIKLGTNIYKK